MAEKFLKQAVVFMIIGVVLTACGKSTSSPPMVATNAGAGGSIAPAVLTPATTPMGINADTVIVQHMIETNARLTALEQAVTGLRTDMAGVNTSLPVLDRLADIEGDIQELIIQLQMLTTPVPPVVGAPAGMVPGKKPLSHGTSKKLGIAIGANPKKGGTPVKTSVARVSGISAVAPEGQGISTDGPGAISSGKPLPVVAAHSQIQLSGIRMGDYDDKMRIVIDSGKPITVTDDLDPVEKLLILDIDGADVETASRSGDKGGFISMISLRGTGPGLGQAVFELTRGTRVQKISSLPPSKDNPNYRTVIDVVK